MGDIRKLTVLHEDKNIVVGDMVGAVNPVVVLNDYAMSALLLALRDVQLQAREMATKEDGVPLITLCAVLAPIVEAYAITRNKYFGGVSATTDAANLEREIQGLFKELERVHQPK